MSESFLTIRKRAQVEIAVKKSKFLATAAPVNDESEANELIDQIKEEHRKATHNVYAYLIDERLMRLSDDGEPAGTAGKPVLEVIRQQNLVRTGIVVTRYFGGTLLGAGGLVRAYAEAARRALAAAGIVKKRLYRELTVTIGYQWLGPVQRQLEVSGGIQGETVYAEQVTLSCLLPASDNGFARQVLELTAGEAELEEKGCRYL